MIYGSTNEDYGSSRISLCDLDRDGRPDVLYTNADGLDHADPGARPWHSVQWLENLGDENFRCHRIGDRPGAYRPAGVDLDGDGATDIVAVRGFNDWKNPEAAALVLSRNDRHQNFTPHVLAHAPTRLITCVAGDFAGSVRPRSGRTICRTRSASTARASAARRDSPRGLAERIGSSLAKSGFLFRAK